MLQTSTLRGLLLLFLLGIAGVIWIPFEPHFSLHASTCDCLEVHFLNIGQGDAILFETPDNHQLLIDGGPDGTVLRRLSEELSFFDRTIDVVIATHPDADHIGGLIDVLERYLVNTIIRTTNVNDTPTADTFSRTLENESAQLISVKGGERYQLGQDLIITILSPTNDATDWDSNTSSIVTLVEYKDTSFLLTGDAPVGIENYLVNQYGTLLQSDVLKLGHHGSKTSTSEEFLDMVLPTYAVVSAGIDNRYGHPHQDVIGRVFARDIQTFHTGTDGTVTFVSDGERVWKE